jgi:arylsulfatase A-like enzyme
MDTPFQWTKQVASHFGGTRNGLCISWAKRITARGEIRSQFHHVIDIAPTILEAVGVQAPLILGGVTQMPMEGVSMAYTFEDANAPTRHLTQYFEITANRGLYHDGWMASTTPLRPPWMVTGVEPDPDDYPWELYHVAEDFNMTVSSGPEVSLDTRWTGFPGYLG